MKVIAIEGIDCSGKGTQTKMLVDALINEGYMVGGYSFPRYGEEIGKLIGKYLKGEITLTPEAFHMLYAVDRQDFMKTIYYMETQGYDFLVCDRFTLSNLAFGKAKGLSLNWLKALESNVKKPDITFLIDIPVHISTARKSARRDKHESDLQLLAKTREAYLTLITNQKLEGNSVVIIDGKQSKDDIHKIILRYTKKYNSSYRR